MLAIVWHSRTGASRALATAVAEGAAEAGQLGDPVLIAAADVEPSLLFSADAYVFACPENLGVLSGTMKEMFDRCYYPLLGRVEGRPYATIIAAGSDGRGAQTQLDRIVTGWRLRRVAEPMIVNFAAQTPEAILEEKTVPPPALASARDLGQALCAGLIMGVF